MRYAIALALAAVGLSWGLGSLATPAGAGGRELFEALGLVRFDSGIRASEFTLPNLDGTPVRVSARGGVATLLMFWATW